MADLYIRYPGTVSSSSFPLLAPDGTASAPSYSFTNSPSTGMYSSALNTLAFSTNGTLAGSISSAQAWTIGASGSTANQAINGTNLTFNSAGGGAIQNLSASGQTANHISAGRVSSTSGLQANLRFQYNDGSTSPDVADIRVFNTTSATAASAGGLFRINTRTPGGSLTSGFEIDQNQVVTIGASASTASHTVNGSALTIQSASGSNATMQIYSTNTASYLYMRGRVNSANALQNTSAWFYYDGTTNRPLFEIDIYNTSATASSSGGVAKFSTTTTAGSQNVAMTLDEKQNVVVGSAALSTSATDGFLYIETCAGAPTGVPTSYTGRVAMVYDTTNNKLYVYNSGWKGVTLA